MGNAFPGLRERLLDWLDPARLGGVLVRPRTRYVLSWVLALAAGTVALSYAWAWASKPGRADGNDGHVNIDFGGQYLLARMVVLGRGPQLYDRDAQRRVLEASYPSGDAQELFDSTIARNGPEDPAGRVGGPLYPPVQALLFAPLGVLPPQTAYRVVQVTNLALVFVAGWLICSLTGGRVWWPVAATLLMVFPGFAGAINLGQNPVLSLTLLLLGWWLLGRGRPGLGGVSWGLLAFKPVWAAAFFLAPLLTRRWRFASAMLLTGLALGALTLPVVGWQAWLEWLAVGRLASQEYHHFESWVILSRDLLNLPHRWLLHFDHELAADPGRPLPTLLGWALWLAVVGATAFVALARRRAPAPLDGPPAAFILLGAYLSCYHFMYYDVLLAALPVCLLFTGPGSYREVRFWPPAVLLALLIALPYLCAFLDPTHHYPPCDTFCLLALWGWSGWSWLDTAPDEVRKGNGTRMNADQAHLRGSELNRS
jgi:hypothetical protein